MLELIISIVIAQYIVIGTTTLVNYLLLKRSNKKLNDSINKMSKLLDDYDIKISKDIPEDNVKIKRGLH